MTNKYSEDCTHAAVAPAFLGLLFVFARLVVGTESIFMLSYLFM